MLEAVLLGLTVISIAVLLRPRVRDNPFWRAMVTPLASIIGSGFLVVVPLLGHIVAAWAPVAMAGVVALAYLVGHAIRFNIEHLEPRLEADEGRLLRRLEVLSDVALALSYFVSVTFYLRLLSAFALRGLGVDDEMLAKIITTVIIVTISTIGWWRGLAALERLEEYSVSVKLSIIAALLVGWAVHDVGVAGSASLPGSGAPLEPLELVRTLAGVLIVVQGFETSRYLGEHYEAALRVRSMRAAQLVSGAIYIVFVALCVPTLVYLPSQVDETAIIGLSGKISTILPPMLVIAALMSQLSAAVADTVGAGGLLSQGNNRPLMGPGRGYLTVGLVSVVLTWAADVFEIIALASRAFAFYYAVQALLAGVCAHRMGRRAQTAWFLGLMTLLLVVAVIAIPAG